MSRFHGRHEAIEADRSSTCILLPEPPLHRSFGPVEQTWRRPTAPTAPTAAAASPFRDGELGRTRLERKTGGLGRRILPMNLKELADFGQRLQANGLPPCRIHEFLPHGV